MFDIENSWNIVNVNDDYVIDIDDDIKNNCEDECRVKYNHLLHRTTNWCDKILSFIWGDMDDEEDLYHIRDDIDYDTDDE